jgi:hypothetical protein
VTSSPVERLRRRLACVEVSNGVRGEILHRRKRRIWALARGGIYTIDNYLLNEMCSFIAEVPKLQGCLSRDFVLNREAPFVDGDVFLVAIETTRA